MAIKTELGKKISTIAFLVFIAGCLLQRDRLIPLIGRVYKAFRGYFTPTLIVPVYLALKCLLSRNKNISCLKAATKDFLTGASHLPHSLILRIGVNAVAGLIFKTLSIREYHPDFEKNLSQVSAFEIVIKGPFMEELLFREFLQGSSVSTMKLINSIELGMGKDVAFTDESISIFSRIFSAATFGLLHFDQSAVQAIGAGVSAYCYETWLYERNGFFASFGIHCANNLFVFNVLKALKVM